MRKGADEKQDDKIVSPMPGNIVKLNVIEGQEVADGEIVAVIEAMQMQSNYKVNSNCKIKKIYVEEGESINANQVLIDLEILNNDDNE